MRSHWIPRLALSLAVIVGGSAAMSEEIAGYSGEQAFRRFCSSCHGPGGEGNGPVAASFRNPVPDLTRIAQRRGGKFPPDVVRRVIDGTAVVQPHGPRDMPVWGREFWMAQGADAKAKAETAALLDRLVDYLASLQR